MTFSGTKLGAWYLLAQGIAIAGWWLYLALNPSAVQVFVPPGASQIELVAFRAPDLFVAAPVSIAAGIALLCRTSVAVPLAWAASGAVVYAFVLFVVPAVLVSVEAQLAWPLLEFRPLRLPAALFFTGFSALGLWSGMTMAARGFGTPLPFDGTNRLVTTGPYGWVRNPMVIAGLGQGTAVGLWLGSWTVLGYVVLGGAIWNLLIRPAEERDLRTTFGDEFDQYCREVPCWRPRWRR